MELSYRLLADLVLVLHAALVAFVVGGLVLVVVGNRHGRGRSWVQSWAWVNGLRFRIVHLAAIAFVTAQAWLGATCPLTRLEMWLRAKAGLGVYEGDFIAHWLHWLLYYRAPAWVFVLAYSGFALLVLLAWWRYPPQRRGGSKTGSERGKTDLGRC